jgi:3',5'-cyclic AMP phosphodiesterase CpdA
MLANQKPAALPSRQGTPGGCTRRDLLRLGAGSLLTLGLWPGALRAADEPSGEDFSFVAVNDPHFMDEKCGLWLQTAVAKMKACSPQPELCLMAGDYAENGTLAELAGARDAFKGLGIPVHGVIGNHDYQPNDDRKAYEEVFPNQINYQFDHRGWQFMALDTTEGLKANRTKISGETLRWVDEHLPKFDRKKPLVLLSHFQLGPGINNRPLNTDALLERFKEHNLRAAFCGHFHGFTESKLGEAVFTTNQCLSLKKPNHDRTKEKGFFHCQVKDGVIQRTFVEVPVPA